MTQTVARQSAPADPQSTGTPQAAVGPASSEAPPTAQTGHVTVAAANEAVARLAGIVRKLRLPSFSMPRLRLIPGVIFVAVLMLGVRTTDLVNGFNARALDAGTPTRAQNVPAEPEPEAAPEAAPATVEREPPAAEVGSAEPSVAMLPPGERSQTEMDLLQNLSTRRAEMDERERALSQREALLAVAEQRLSQKTAELETLRGQIEGMLAKVDEQREAQIAGLVGIYENMRPADAAAIFDGLDIEVLINVLDRMREQKSAAILAGMNPERARQVTTELAQRQKPPALAN